MSDHEIRLGDCLDALTGLASLADKSVDHVICDPPYRRDLYLNMRTNAGDPFRQSPRNMESRRRMANMEIGAIDDILDEVAAHALRIARRWIVIFCDDVILARWHKQLGAALVRTGVWVKPDATPQISGDRPSQAAEWCAIAHGPQRKRWNGGGRPAIWYCGREQTGRPDHPCPKPVALMQELIADFTDPGELICDPFAGSGTTGVACKRLGRRFIGWEKDAIFWERAVRRLENTRQQYELLPRGPKPKQQKMVLP